MTVWKRFKNLWALSALKEEQFDPIFEQTRSALLAIEQRAQATIIPYQKEDPIKKITEEHAD